MKNHKIFITALIIIFVLDLIVINYSPIFEGWKIIEDTFTLFSFSIQGFFLLIALGFYLLYRWIKTGKNNTSTLSWSIAFLAYSFLLIGLVLQSLGVPWADMTKPLFFFVFRNVMILWAALMYYGVIKIVSNKRKWQLIPTFLILFTGYGIFLYGLFILKNIERMMYIFLYSIWIPVCILIVYLFWLYGSNSNTKSPKVISLGFIFLTLTYLAWAPTHATYNYWIIFALFNLAITTILIGFIILPLEVKILQLERLET